MLSVTSPNFCVTGDVVKVLRETPTPRSARRRKPLVREATRDSKESTPSLVCTQCTCRRCCVRHSARVPGLQSGSSESEDEGVTLEQVMRVVGVFHQKPSGGRSMSAIRTVLQGYTCRQNVNTQQMQQVFGMLNDSEADTREIGLLMLQSLAQHPQCLLRILSEDILTILTEILNDSSATCRIQCAHTLTQLLRHKDHSDMWMSEALTALLPFLTQFMGCAYSSSERVACGEVLTVLARHGHTARAIYRDYRQLLDICLNDGLLLQGVYCDVMTVLTTHLTPDDRQDAIVTCVPTLCRLLQDGPCEYQSKTLDLLSAMAAAGSVAVSTSAAPGVYTLVYSVLVQSNCRKAKASAARVMTAAMNTGSHDVILGEVEGFLSRTADNDKPRTPRPRYNDQVHAGIDALINVYMQILRKEARIETTVPGSDVSVRLTPLVDRNPDVLRLLCSVIRGLHHLAICPCNRNTQEKGIEINRDNVCLNKHVVRHLLDAGFLCTVDILHKYTSIFSLSNTDDRTSTPLRFHQPAWGNNPSTSPECAVKKPYSSSSQAQRVSGDLFCEDELYLIQELLSAIKIVASASCPRVLSEFRGHVQDKLTGGELKKSGVSAEEEEEDELLDLDDLDQYDDSSTPDNISSEPEADDIKCSCRYVDEDGLHRLIRGALYEAGVIQTVCPWLITSLICIKILVIGVLQRMIHSLQEKTLCMAIKSINRRPVSAMTQGERERNLNVAMHQLSSKMRVFIREALGSQPEQGNQGNVTPGHDHGDVNSRHHHGDPHHVGSDERNHSNGNISHHHGGGDTARRHGDLTAGDSHSKPSPRHCQPDAVQKQRSSALKSLQKYALDERPISRKENRPLKCDDARHDVRCKPTTSTSHRTQRGKHNVSGQNGDRETAIKHGENSVNLNILQSNSVRPHSAQLLQKPPLEFTHEQYTKFARTRPSSAKTEKIRPVSAARNKTLSDNKGGDSVMTSRSLTSTRNKKVTITETPRPHGKESIMTARGGSHLSSRGRGMCSWKPSLDLSQPITYQCQVEIVTCCGSIIFNNLFVKNDQLRLVILDFLEHFIKHTQGKSIMKLSEYGLMPKLIDFLRVVDDNDTLCITALLLLQSAITTQPQLKQLYMFHGGPQLLVLMSTSHTGHVQQQVIDTMKMATRGPSAYGMSSRTRRVQSAPPTTSYHNNCKQPDIWDQIMLRWRQEDKVTQALTKKRV